MPGFELQFYYKILTIHAYYFTIKDLVRLPAHQKGHDLCNHKHGQTLYFPTLTFGLYVVAWTSQQVWEPVV